MASLEEIRNNRLEKLNQLKKEGINPYPISSNQNYKLASAIENFSKLAESQQKVSLAGRVLSLRPQGGLTFITFNDGTAKFQGLLKKSEEGEDKSFELFSNTVDIGDFIEVSGTLFVTKREEKTIQVLEWKMLAKSLRPLPEKWHGLQDIEERFRKRYLDTLMSEEVKNRFITRSKIISEVRRFLDSEGFLEVETPVLQPLAGGANALPFITHHNALDIDLFLRIAPELYLKKLLIGGFPKVYEICRNFRNEGIDTVHNPEFTNVEFYEAYSTAEKQRAFVEKLFRSVVNKIFNKEKITYDGHEIDFSEKFETISYFDLLKKYGEVENPEKVTLDEIKEHADKIKVKYEDSDPLEKIMDNIYKKTCRPNLIQPTFIIDYPVNYVPLAKKLENNPNLADAFQLVVGGMELIKAFSELNDPIDQEERFLAQEKNRKAGDEESQHNDTEFVEALEYGMPPAGGVGIGLERLTMLLTDQKSIREVILFPTLRPKK